MYLGAASGTTVSHVSDIVGPVSTKLSQRFKLLIKYSQIQHIHHVALSTQYSQEVLHYQFCFFFIGKQTCKGGP